MYLHMQVIVNCRVSTFSRLEMFFLQKSHVIQDILYKICSDPMLKATACRYIHRDRDMLRG